MSGHEARINDALKSLGEEFRLGMVAADEYRKRRRLILDSWNERDVTTSPGSLKSLTTSPRPAAPAAPRPAVVAPPPKKSKAPIIVVVVAVLIVAGGAAFVVAKRSAPPAPARPAPSAEVMSIKQAADEFLTKNDWDAEPIEGFLAQWTQLSAADRAQALEEPSLRTLRHELQQNLQAESQLVPANAPPDQRRRLDALTRFARELGL